MADIIQTKHLNRDKISIKKINGKIPTTLIFEKIVGITSGMGSGESI